MTGWAKALGWLAALCGFVYIGAKGYVPSDKPGDYHWNEFARLPVVDGGRIKPLDTFGRVTLQIISGRQDVIDENRNHVASAIKWLADVWSSPDMFSGPASKLKVFRIDSDQLLSFLKLSPRPGFYRYSMQELEPNFRALVREHAKVEKIAAKQRGVIEKTIFDLGEHVALYQAVAARRTPLVMAPQSTDETWKPIAAILSPLRQFFLEKFVEQLQASGRKPGDLTAAEIAKIDVKCEELSLNSLGEVSKQAAAFVRITDRYRFGDVAGFNEAVAEYRNSYYPHLTSFEASMVRFEAFFNHLAPFYHCSIMYVMVIILAAISWMGPAEYLRRPAVGLLTATFIIHTAALIARMVIQQRPPVTNLYSSAVFIGWGCVGLLLLLERWNRNGVGAALAGTTGAATLVIAHFLSQSGDTLEMMQAVLDTNFWLAIHVTTVTLGYTATFVAGFIGAFYILRGVMTPTMTPAAGKSLGGMMYGVICFAMLLSFFGTVSGGIWADQSWGRFWGWDPKENGAVLIVIWNALILHARWAGMVKQRGIAVLAVLGNVVTAWSWFGTNQLGVGLHSYGFTSGVSLTMVLFDAGMLIIVALGLLPERHWWSRQSQSEPSAKSAHRTPAAAQ